MATRKTKTPPIPRELPAEAAPGDNADDAAPTPDAAPSSQPQQQGVVALTETPAVRAADRPLWQQLVDHQEHQIGGYEAAIGQLEQLCQQQLDLAQQRLEETTRMAQAAIGWLVELNTSGSRLAIALARTAAAPLSRPVA